MLLRHRSPEIDVSPATLSSGLEHLDQGPVAVLRWLNANQIDYVLVGPVARAIHGELAARGPVAIVPAPYIRNYDRLAAALSAQDATLRSTRPGGDRGPRGADPGTGVKLTGDKLARGRRWLLRFAGYDLDVESSSRRPAGLHGPHETGAPAGDGARYQELLYEAARHEIATGVAVEVAAPEDLEHFSHVRRTGVAPEFRVTRNETASGPPAAPAQPYDASGDA
jgi:hypothetical protein